MEISDELVREVVGAAVLAGREGCARAVCKYCAGKDAGVRAEVYRLGDGWVRLVVERGDNIPDSYWCAAGAIYKRIGR